MTWLAHLFKACVKQHHRELVAPLRRFIPRDAVVLDVGGHAGQFAKLFAGMAPDGHVYTVEPGSYALSILRPAIRLNRLRNITVVPVGLSDRPGSATLRVPFKQSGSLGFGLSHVADVTERGVQIPAMEDVINLTTIDRLAEGEGLSRLDFIKADIDGWELRMIMGGEADPVAFSPQPHGGGEWRRARRGRRHSGVAVLPCRFDRLSRIRPGTGQATISSGRTGTGQRCYFRSVGAIVDHGGNPNVSGMRPISRTVGGLIRALWSSSSDPFVSAGHTVVGEVITGAIAGSPRPPSRRGRLFRRHIKSNMLRG